MHLSNLSPQEHSPLIDREVFCELLDLEGYVARMAQLASGDFNWISLALWQAAE